MREVVLAHVVEAGTDSEVQRDFELAAEAKLADYAQEFEKQGFRLPCMSTGENPRRVSSRLRRRRRRAW